MARLVDIEKDIKRLIEENGVEDERIYTKIFELSYFFLRRNKLMSTPKEAEDVAYTIAEELYLKIYNGGEIYSWIGYINRSYQAFIRVINNMNRSEIIDTSSDYELREAIVSMSTSNNNNESQRRTLDKIYFESLPLVIDNVMNRSIYDKYTSNYLNSKLSILLSLQSGNFISYNQEEIKDEMYTRMLYVKVKDKIVEAVALYTREDDDNSNLMNLFNLSILDNLEN